MDDLFQPLAGARAAALRRRSTYAAGDLVGGRYRLLELIGEGGMGTVWRAHSLSLGRDVALKLLRREGAAPEAAARLLSEARAAGSLEHPSIVRVFDFGETAFGDPFLVMELLEGESLGAVLELHGNLSELSAVRLMLPVASALVTAHAGGVVHRDIKPDNIVLVPLDGEEGAKRPKLVDFGIARLAGDRRLTTDGTLIGSPAYMAPEQAMGEEDLGAQIDVWAFSVVLYELVMGVPPFVRANASLTLAAVVQEDPPPTTELGGDLQLWAILVRGLAKDRADRWPDMASLRNALAGWARGRGATTDISGAPLAPSTAPSKAPPPSIEAAAGDEDTSLELYRTAPPAPPAPAIAPEPPVAPAPLARSRFRLGVALGLAVALALLLALAR